MNRDIASTVPPVPHPRDRDNRDTFKSWTQAGTSSGTASLKALARSVFERDTLRDSERTAEGLLSRPLSRFLVAGTAGTVDRGGTERHLDAADLRYRYDERAAICQFDGHQDRLRAESRAWHEVAAICYRQHGTQVSHHLCAGCGRPIDDSGEVLLMPHGERVHAGTVQRCILAYGRRWKGEAAVALTAIGISTSPTVS